MPKYAGKQDFGWVKSNRRPPPHHRGARTKIFRKNLQKKVSGIF